MRGGMEIMQKFMAYAGEFEQTYADDDWSRLTKHFADDAVYEVQAQGFGCRLAGPAAILAGIRKSVDNFDRRFESREIKVLGAPEVSEDTVRLKWNVLYDKEGCPQFVLRGQSEVRFAGGVIAYLCDSYDPQVGVELAEWCQRTGVKVDPSYV